jgi:hypothetical protein
MIGFYSIRGSTRAPSGLCCRNEQAQSRGEDHLPNRASVVAEVSGNAELPFHDLLHEFNSDQNLARVVESLETEQVLRVA